jgi:hypothetical protein
VRVRHALGVTRRPGRVTHRCCVAFVEILGPGEDRRLGGKELRVAVNLDRRERFGEHRCVAVAIHDEVLDVGERVRPARCFAEQGYQRSVDDDDPVVGMVDHVGELFREQTDVERVQHRAHGWNREVALEVFLVVPAERAHSFIACDPESTQSVRQSTGVRCDFPKCGRSSHRLACGVVDRVDGGDG